MATPAAANSGFSKNVQGMFSAIAPRYDFLNRLLSAGRDAYWRRAAIEALAPSPEHVILDLATGTADAALALAERHPAGPRVIGVDFSWPMLLLGKKKIVDRGAARCVRLLAADGERLPFAGARFHGAVIAFGIRNFASLDAGLREMFRVLKAGGRIVVLEFSIPDFFLFRMAYLFYFNYVLPLIGRLISGHHAAYSYLPRSVAGFPERERFIESLEMAGFKDVACRKLTFGITAIYTGLKHA